MAKKSPATTKAPTPVEATTDEERMHIYVRLTNEELATVYRLVQANERITVKRLKVKIAELLNFGEGPYGLKVTSALDKLISEGLAFVDAVPIEADPKPKKVARKKKDILTPAQAGKA